MNITEERLNRLKEIIPEAFTENKIDWEKLKAALGDDIEFKNERYVLNWAGKSDAFRALQSASTATLVPCREESVNFDKTENIFIEGENLEVLKVLQKSYFGKIKMIYIDPPYNTGNDNFIYPDKFAESREEYLNRIGDKDETGFMTREGLFRKNSKDSGHYHSNWLSMMYPRLFLARNLLRDDGVIFVSIDDNEVHNLRLLMNEVFGEENFVDTICWKKKYGGGAKEKYLVSVHEYIVVYAKTKIDLPEIMIEFEEEKARRFYKYKDEKFETLGYYRTHPLEAVKSFDIRENLRFPVVAPDGTEVYPKRQWRWSKQRFEEALLKDEVIFSKNKDGEWVLSSKQYLNEENGEQRKTKAQSLIDDIFTQEGTKEVVDTFGDAKIFPFPKPNRLVKKLIEIGGLYNNDIILDFFSGSATTAHSVLALNKEDLSASNAQAGGGNRKFIMVQLPEKCDENSEAYKAGYKTIAEIGKERIRRVIEHLTLNIEHGSKNKKEDMGQGILNINHLTDKKKDKTEQASLFGSKDSMINEKCSMINENLGFKVFKLQESNFKIWHSKLETEEQLVEQLKLHLEPLDEHAKTEDFLYELLLKSGVPLTAKIEEKNGYILVNDNEIALMLEKVDDKIINKVIAMKPSKVITLDRLFKNNDQLKTNTALQMKDAGIEFKVI